MISRAHTPNSTPRAMANKRYYVVVGTREPEELVDGILEIKSDVFGEFYPTKPCDIVVRAARVNNVSVETGCVSADAVSRRVKVGTGSISANSRMLQTAPLPKVRASMCMRDIFQHKADDLTVNGVEVSSDTDLSAYSIDDSGNRTRWDIPKFVICAEYVNSVRLRVGNVSIHGTTRNVTVRTGSVTASRIAEGLVGTGSVRIGDGSRSAARSRVRSHSSQNAPVGSGVSGSVIQSADGCTVFVGRGIGRQSGGTFVNRF